MNVAIASETSSLLTQHDHISHDAHHDHEKKGLLHYLWSYDHKMIGMQYLWTSLFFLLIGGGLALAIRFQLGFPNHPLPLIGRFLPSTLVSDDGAIIPGGFNMLVTMHATIMVFFVVMPIVIGAFGNYLIPLKIGARDMAFPLLNEVSYWLFAASGIIMLAAFFAPGGAAASGWTAYAPLSSTAAYNQTQIGQSLWGAAILVNGFSSLAGATNYITTIITMRAPGMTMFRGRLYKPFSLKTSTACGPPRFKVIHANHRFFSTITNTVEVKVVAAFFGINRPND